MGDIFIPTFVIVMLIVGFGTISISLISEMMNDIKQIKKQLSIEHQKSNKSKTPLSVINIEVDKFKHGICPICNHTVWDSDRKCKNCGQKIKWDNKDEINK